MLCGDGRLFCNQAFVQRIWATFFFGGGGGMMCAYVARERYFCKGETFPRRFSSGKACLSTAPLEMPRRVARFYPQTLVSEPSDTVRRLAAFGIGASLSFLEPEQQAEVVSKLLSGGASGKGAGGAGASAGSSGDWTVLHGQRMALYAALR